MAKPPDAFLSYTHFDDQREDGKISQLRKELADEIRAVTAEPFEIFEDVDGIGLGENWSDKLDEMLYQARFFIPILTASYFKSEACRKELATFAELERKVGRSDLILPIYWRTSPVLEDGDLREADLLARLIYSRQRSDWRELRLRTFRNVQVRSKLEDLALHIEDARIRSLRVGASPRTVAAEPHVPTRLDVEEAELMSIEKQVRQEISALVTRRMHSLGERLGGYLGDETSESAECIIKFDMPYIGDEQSEGKHDSYIEIWSTVVASKVFVQKIQMIWPNRDYAGRGPFRATYLHVSGNHFKVNIYSDQGLSYFQNQIVDLINRFDLKIDASLEVAVSSSTATLEFTGFADSEEAWQRFCTELERTIDPIGLLLEGPRPWRGA